MNRDDEYDAAWNHFVTLSREKGLIKNGDEVRPFLRSLLKLPKGRQVGIHSLRRAIQKVKEMPSCSVNTAEGN